ncbi:Ribonuclease H-like domain containing protein [Trema orientale]|uniref:Ribonuclease H-like domain containing protein n=1 Tax=Trema orientale TaxID=63057 RepID=A0A2P5EYI2_TREOI|nr:Ribonuclease H-like domain containing protein [Trema orientale]
MADILFGLSHRLMKNAFELIYVVLWSIWNRRNNILFNGVIRDVLDLLDWAQCYLMEFQVSKTQTEVFTSTPLFSGNIGWSRPVEGELKLNVNVSVLEGSSVIGVSGTIRDSEGVVLTCWDLKLIGGFDVVIAELLTIREGIRLAIEFGCPLHTIESDSLQAVQAINHPNPCFDVASVVKDIKFFIDSAGYGSCHHIPRSRNIVAYDLASFAI